MACHTAAQTWGTHQEYLCLLLDSQQIILWKYANMLEPFKNIQGHWALKEIINVANDKCKKLCEKDDILSKQSILTLMSIVLEANEKILNMRWTDYEGLMHGVKTYSQAIKNL